jgi:hypothetical protein
MVAARPLAATGPGNNKRQQEATADSPKPDEPGSARRIFDHFCFAVFFCFAVGFFRFGVNGRFRSPLLPPTGSSDHNRGFFRRSLFDVNGFAAVGLGYAALW